MELWQMVPADPPSAPVSTGAAPLSAQLPPAAPTAGGELWRTIPADPATASAPAPAAADQRDVFGVSPPGPGFTDAVIRGLPGGALPDVASSALAASAEWAKNRIVSPEGESEKPWSQLYQESLERKRAPQREWAAAHPTQEAIGQGIGSLVGIAGGAPAGVGGVAPAAIARGVQMVPQAATRLVGQAGLGAALGGTGGYAEAALDPNASLASMLTGAGAGAVGGAATALPAVVPAAKASGLTLSELIKLTKDIAPGGYAMMHPAMALLGLPGAISAAGELGKTAVQRVAPSWALGMAPAVGAEASRLGTTYQAQRPSGG